MAHTLGKNKQYIKVPSNISTNQNGPWHHSNFCSNLLLKSGFSCNIWVQERLRENYRETDKTLRALTKPFNNRGCLLASSAFGSMLSVGAIRFEDWFCASRKGGTGEVGGYTTLPDSAQWRLPVESLGQGQVAHLSAFLHKTGVENAPFTL